MKALFTTDPLLRQEAAELKKLNVDVEYSRPDLSEEELIKQLKNKDIHVLGGMEIITQRVLDNTNLKLIIFYGTGYQDYIDIQECIKRQIPVAYTPNANAYSVAEYTVAMILDSVKRVTHLNNQVRKGNWNKNTTWNLQNKTLGIIGMGNIGYQVARIMHKGFGMGIIYTSRRKNITAEQELNTIKTDKQQLLQESDIVSLHLPLLSETQHIIGKKELDIMKPNSTLINTSRAELIDPLALHTTLNKGKISAAYFDTYYIEPTSLKNDPYGLLSLSEERFVLTPHTAYSSIDAIKRMNDMVIENIQYFIKSNNLKNPI